VAVALAPAASYTVAVTPKYCASAYVRADDGGVETDGIDDEQHHRDVVQAVLSAARPGAR